jgi:hypothetical protein
VRSRKLFQGKFGFPKTQVARLVEGAERVIEAGDCLLVGGDMKVADRGLDKLGMLGVLFTL